MGVEISKISAQPPTISSPVSTYPLFSSAYSSWCLPYWSVMLGPKWDSSADCFICQSGCPLIQTVSCVIKLARRERDTLNVAPASEDVTGTYRRWPHCQWRDSVFSIFSFLVYLPEPLSSLHCLSYTWSINLFLFIQNIAFIALVVRLLDLWFVLPEFQATQVEKVEHNCCSFITRAYSWCLSPSLYCAYNIPLSSCCDIHSWHFCKDHICLFTRPRYWVAFLSLNRSARCKYREEVISDQAVKF